MAVAALSGIFSAAGSIAGIVGSVISYNGQRKAEEIRKNQMNLEAARARREQVRKAQVARAAATASAWNQGAGTSSALSGGQSQILGQAARNTVAINSDQNFSKQMFDANRQIAQGNMIGTLGAGISSLGGAVASTAGTITRVGGSDLPFMKNLKNGSAYQ